VATLAASKALRRLRDAGLFIQKDRGSPTWYQPTARMLGRNDQESARAAQPAGELAAQGADATGLSSNPPGLSSNPGALSSNLGPQDGNPRHPDQRNDPLADARRQALLGRNAETVRQNYLRPLLRAGRIAMTRPDKPNDPDQANRA
jgi:ATP-dependent DNA helicase RecG